jgi:hypothetical protein
LLWPKYLREQPKGRKIYFGLQFQRIKTSHVRDYASRQSRAVHIMEARKEKKGNTGRGPGKIKLQQYAPSNLLLPKTPTSYFSPLSNNAIT